MTNLSLPELIRWRDRQLKAMRERHWSFDPNLLIALQQRIKEYDKERTDNVL